MFTFNGPINQICKYIFKFCVGYALENVFLYAAPNELITFTLKNVQNYLKTLKLI
jgi:hypothetical protein